MVIGKARSQLVELEDGRGTIAPAGSFQRLADLEASATEILNSPEPKTFRFVITEDALTVAVGGPDIMREQRRHIPKLLESNDSLTVQVLRSGTCRSVDPPHRQGGLIMRDSGWFKSTFSSSGGEACVEVRFTGEMARMRNSKNPSSVLSAGVPASVAMVKQAASTAESVSRTARCCR